MSSSGEILLVDDNQENLQILASILRTAGHGVRLATGGIQALRSVTTRRPDLVLLDIRMPDLDGLATCARLRSDPGMAEVPIIFLSASDAVEDRLAAFTAGGQDFISKPFQATEVLARIATHLQLARARIEMARLNDLLANQVIAESCLRANAEEAAADRKARLDLTLEAADLGTWEVASGSGQIRFDERASRILGLPTVGGMGWRAFLDAVPESRGTGITGRWERSRSQAALFELDGWWTPPVGRTRRRIRLRGRPLSPAGSTDSAGMVGLVWDVTDEHLLRERLAQHDRLESIGLLAGGVAHDFNNHLAVIIAELDILSMMPGEDGIRRHLDSIAQAANASSTLVRDLLSFARQREVVRSRIDLAALAGRVARLAGRSLGSAVRVQPEFPATPRWVDGEAAQLENALLNLCINARDAMPDGGTLRLAVHDQDCTDDMRCEICHAGTAGRWTAISVIDTGTGIPDEVRTRMLDPFYSTKGEHRGDGLGLASVAGCVAMHGGHMLVDSEAGRGTTFTILLPPRDPPAEEAPAPAPPRTRTGRLLVLDDQAGVREAIGDGLARMGWTVTPFAVQGEAIGAWTTPPGFDIALIDMTMPGLGGIAVFRALRQADPQARVVLMSGNASGGNIEALLGEGLAGFVHKPVKLRQLHELLGSLLAKDPT